MFENFFRIMAVLEQMRMEHDLQPENQGTCIMDDYIDDEEPEYDFEFVDAVLEEG